jgi:hypothetical protein
MTFDHDKKLMLTLAACCVLLAAIGAYAYVLNQTPDSSVAVRYPGLSSGEYFALAPALADRDVY